MQGSRLKTSIDELLDTWVERSVGRSFGGWQWIRRYLQLKERFSSWNTCCGAEFGFTQITGIRSHFKLILCQYDYVIRHIAGERNCWESLLSRWVIVPHAGLRSVAVFAGSKPHSTMSSKEFIRKTQLEAHARMRMLENSDGCLTTPGGCAVMEDDGLYLISMNGNVL